MRTADRIGKRRAVAVEDLADGLQYTDFGGFGAGSVESLDLVVLPSSRFIHHARLLYNIVSFFSRLPDHLCTQPGLFCKVWPQGLRGGSGSFGSLSQSLQPPSLKRRSLLMVS